MIQPKPATADGDDKTLSFGQALSLEYEAIWPREPSAAPAEFADADAYLKHVLADQHPKQMALCLSGGGIRSAAFALGVIQTMASQGLLARFHYLSTVSGGGYIGSWLQAWMLEEARRRDGPRARVGTADVLEVQRQLTSGASPTGPLDQLRGFTSYLTPQPGLASPDTWAGAILWLRNVAINWAVFGPALLAVALVPLVYRDLIEAVRPALTPWLVLAALAAVASSAIGACFALPSHRGQPRPSNQSGTTSIYVESAAIVRSSARPAWIWAALLPLAMSPVLLGGGGPPEQVLHVQAGGHVFGPAAVLGASTGVALMAAYLIAWAMTPRDQGSELYASSLGPWIAGCVAACMILAFGVRLGYDTLTWMPRREGAAWLAVLGPFWTMLAHLSLSTVFVGLRTKARRGDLDREWLARLSSLKVVPALLAAVLAAVCLILPGVLQHADIPHLYASSVSVFTAVSGVTAALLGTSAKTPPVAPGGPRLLSVATVTVLATFGFAIGLFALLASAGQSLARLLSSQVDPTGSAPIWAATLAAAVGAFVVALLLGRRVNVNRFSLHNVYRNRLVRAFLGSARGSDRNDQDQFTKFAAADNPRLCELAPAAGQTRRLFPVIGTSLNLTHDGRRKWAERKAAPFVMTPVACGSESLKGKESLGGKGGRFVDPALYGGVERESGVEGEPLGITLGTAMAVSGAAVSPNMGYHSSPATAFLLTLFNLRLGIWLPNPATTSADAQRYAQPPHALSALLDEMLGRVGDRGSSIYLSDGGHFDNLGLYEMVRRGCRLIVVVDTGEDPEHAFSDLGDALRKIRIDQQVEITFPTPLPIAAAAEWTDRNRPFALGRITWPSPNRTSGRVLYIKPSLFEGVPMDLRAYARRDPSFPNDSTLDQFFTESRFESYRRLGEFIGHKLEDRDYAGAILSEFLEELRGHDPLPMPKGA